MNNLNDTIEKSRIIISEVHNAISELINVNRKAVDNSSNGIFLLKILDIEDKEKIILLLSNTLNFAAEFAGSLSEARASMISVVHKCEKLIDELKS
jgi:tetrahydromethanopterin S-methyltransferase subunit A